MPTYLALTLSSPICLRACAERADICVGSPLGACVLFGVAGLLLLFLEWGCSSYTLGERNYNVIVDFGMENHLAICPPPSDARRIDFTEIAHLSTFGLPRKISCWLKLCPKLFIDNDNGRSRSWRHAGGDEPGDKLMKGRKAKSASKVPTPTRGSKLRLSMCFGWCDGHSDAPSPLQNFPAIAHVHCLIAGRSTHAPAMFLFWYCRHCQHEQDPSRWWLPFVGWGFYEWFSNQ